MNRASSATGWVRNPVMKSPDLDLRSASSYGLGWTLSPVTGCLNHTPEGLCLGGGFPCYAYKLANGRLRQRYLANKRIANVIQNPTSEVMRGLADPFYPRLWVERFDLVSLVKAKPRGIFVCDMGELFGDWIPNEWINKVMVNIRHFSQHRFYLLTKQPQNLIKFSPFPDNCWVGVTATNDEMFWDALRWLYRIQAKVKFISIEPYLGQIRIGAPTLIKLGVLDWVIIGAQTKPYKPPKIEWVEEIVRACDKAGVPVFLKYNLKPLIQEAGMGKAGWAAREWVQCKYPILRQEMPE